MADRLSAADMSSLLAERGSIHVHTGGTIIAEGPPPPFDLLLAQIEQRLHLVPRFRQRVTEAPLRFSNPVWTDDPRFDLRWHVRHVALPRPGTLDQLRELVGQIMSVPLDLQRPLWQLYLIEGLEGGRFVLLSKTHHALVDGLAALDVGTIILDPTPDGVEMSLPDDPWEPDQPSPGMLFVRAATDRIGAPLRAARKATAGALTTPRETASRMRRTAQGFSSLASSGPASPRTFFNVEIGRDRRVAYVSARLDDVKGARGERGATVNDVVLASVTGALGSWMRSRSEPLPEHIVALVPVSIRREGEDHSLGNRISTIMVPLPVREADPGRRLEAIRRTTLRLKQSEGAGAAALIIEATGWTPPTINRVLADVMARPLIWNLVVSNVPGPQAPFYLLGRKVLEVYPFVPLSPQNHAISIGAISYDGGIFFGLVADRDVIPDLDVLADALGQSLTEQLAA